MPRRHRGAQKDFRFQGYFRGISGTHAVVLLFPAAPFATPHDAIAAMIFTPEAGRRGFRDARRRYVRL